MGKLFRFPTRPMQGVQIARVSERGWIVNVASPSPDSACQKRFRSEREAVAYAKGFCDATGFELLVSNDSTRNVA